MSKRKLPRGGYSQTAPTTLTERDILRATLASERAKILRFRDENGALRAEIDRLRSERNEYRARFYAVVSLVPADMLAGTLQDARDEYLKTRRILAALREPSVGAVDAAWAVYQAQTWWDERDDMSRALRAAVAAAEQEVGCA